MDLIRYQSTKLGSPSKNPQNCNVRAFFRPMPVNDQKLNHQSHYNHTFDDKDVNANTSWMGCHF